MDALTVLPWWSYGLAGLLGIAFGCVQIWFLRKAIQTESPKQWLIAVKFLLWAAALLAFAFVSIALLITFAVCATLAMLVGCCWLFQKARKEAK